MSSSNMAVIEQTEETRWGNTTQMPKALSNVNVNRANYAAWGASGDPRRRNFRNKQRRQQEAPPTNWSAECNQNVAAPAPWQPTQAGAGFDTNFQEPQGPVAVNLQGLPHALCRQNFLEAMLDQAGLANEVLGCVLGDIKDVGKAQITLANWTAAMRCVAHFDGRRWDNAGHPVMAMVAQENMQQVPNKTSTRNACAVRSRKPRSPKGDAEMWKMGELVMQPVACAVAMPAGPWIMAQQIPSPGIAECSKGGDFADFMDPFSKPRWADQQDEQAKDDDKNENGSTSAGSSGRRSPYTSRDTISSSSNSPDLRSLEVSPCMSDNIMDFACDTDDGF